MSWHLFSWCIHFLCLKRLNSPRAQDKEIKTDRDVLVFRPKEVVPRKGGDSGKGQNIGEEKKEKVLLLQVLSSSFPKAVLPHAALPPAAALLAAEGGQKPSPHEASTDFASPSEHQVGARKTPPQAPKCLYLCCRFHKRLLLLSDCLRLVRLY